MAVRFQRLPAVAPSAALAARAIAILLALLVGAVAIALAGMNPGEMAGSVLSSTFGSVYGLVDLGLLASPLILTGLGVAVALRTGLWNIGAEGQFYMGAFGATAVGLFVSGPDPMILILMVLAGMLGGVVWILIPTLARAYANVNEIITTLLLNFVGLLLVYYVSTGPWRDRKSGVLAATPRIRTEVPELYDALHWGIVVAIGMAILMSLVLRYTTWGYEVRIAGANARAAHYTGMPVTRRIVQVMLLSGAFAGLAGMLELAGTVHRLQGGIANNYGYLGIMVAVLARGSPIGVIFAGLLIAFLLNAGIILQTSGLSTSSVIALTGLILMFTAVGEELAHYRVVRTAPVRGTA